MLPLLLDHGADFKITDKHGNNALNIAVREHRIRTIQYLLIKKLFDINEKDTVNGETGLMAAMKGWDEQDAAVTALTLLLDKKADVNATNNDGDTALMVGAAFGNVVRLNVLISKAGDKIDFRARNNRGHNAAMKVSMLSSRHDSQCVQVLTLLRQHNVDLNVSEGNALLLRSALQGKTKTIEYLLSKKLTDVDIDVNINESKNNDDDASLQLSIGGKRMNMDGLKLLFSKAGNMIDYKNNDGQTAAMEVLLNAYDEHRSVLVLKLLRQYNGDLNRKDDEGNTLLLLAGRMANSMAIEYLLSEKLADVNETNDKGQTALMKVLMEYTYTSSQDFAKVEKTFDILLKQFNGDPNRTDKDGYTALMFGVRNSAEEFDKLKCFVSMCGDSIDYDIQVNGETALDMARREDNTDMLTWLEDLMQMDKIQ